MRECSEVLFLNFFHTVLTLFADLNHVARSTEEHKRRASTNQSSKPANASVIGGDETDDEGGDGAYT